MAEAHEESKSGTGQQNRLILLPCHACFCPHQPAPYAGCLPCSWLLSPGTQPKPKPKPCSCVLTTACRDRRRASSGAAAMLDPYRPQISGSMGVATLLTPGNSHKGDAWKGLCIRGSRSQGPWVWPRCSRQVGDNQGDGVLDRRCINRPGAACREGLRGHRPQISGSMGVATLLTPGDSYKGDALER